MNRVADRLVMVLAKETERYVFIFDDTNEDRAELLRTLARFAANCDLGFTWYDAAVMSQRVRAQA